MLLSYTTILAKHFNSHVLLMLDPLTAWGRHFVRLVTHGNTVKSGTSPMLISTPKNSDAHFKTFIKKYERPKHNDKKGCTE